MKSYKKRSTSSKRSYRRAGPFGKRPWQPFNVSKALYRPLNPYSDSFVHSFRRMGPAVVLTNDAGNFPAFTADVAQTAFFMGSAVSEPIPAAPSGQAQFPFTFTASLDNVLASQEFTNLFDSYRIKRVEIKVEMLMAPAYQFAPSAAPAPFLPEMFYRYDPNDDAVPASWQDLCQSGNAQSFGFADGKPKTISCVPRAAAAIYTSVLANAYAMLGKNQWLDTSNPSSSAKHYAWKFWVRNWNFQGGTGIQFRLTPTYYLDFRRSR